MQKRKHKAIEISSLIIIAVLMVFNSEVQLARASVYMSVPYYSQDTGYYCGPACLQMVFDFYGPPVPQDEIADAARTDDTWPDPYGTFTDEMRRAAHFSNLSTSQGNELATHVTGYTARSLGYAAFVNWGTTIDQLKSLIDKGYPIIVLQWNTLDHDWKHFRVVVGYNDTHIRVHDPMTGLGGANTDYDYSNFTDLWDTPGKYALFVTPWELSISNPASVAEGDTLTVTVMATYPRPSPFSAAYSASYSQATIKLPTGLSLATGESPSKDLTATGHPSGTVPSGDSAAVQWDITADNAGSYSITVEAEGNITGYASAHSTGVFTTDYTYTDRIGGTNSSDITVSPGALQSPTASFTESADTVPVGTPITFDPSGSNDPDGTIVLYEWDWEGDGVYDHSTIAPDTVSHTYTAAGTYTVTLRVTDNDGLTGTATATKTITSAAPAPTIESCDVAEARKDTFNLIEDVYVMGKGYVASTTYDVYVVQDVAVWSDGMAIPSRVPGTATSASSDASGDIPAALVWNNPLILGKYDVVVDVDGDGVYDIDEDALDDSDLEVTAGFFVIPEVPLGTILTTASMIIALVAYAASPKLRRNR